MVSTVKLVLDDVVEDLQQEEDQVVVGGAGVQEPRRAERLEYIIIYRHKFVNIIALSPCSISGFISSSFCTLHTSTQYTY